LDEPGWDTEEVRKRVDLLHILEDFAQGFERLPEAVGLVNDTKKGEIGAILRAVPHIRAMKAKFMAEMTPATLQSVEGPGAVEVSDDFEMCFADDPWLTECLNLCKNVDMPEAISPILSLSTDLTTHKPQ